MTQARTTRFRTAAAGAVALSLGAGLAAPASADTLNFNMTTPWAAGHWLDFGAGRFAELVGILTDGRVNITVFPGGTLGSILEVTQTVQSGVAEVGHAWGGYDWGQDRTGGIVGGWAGGLTPEETIMWLFMGDGEGARLVREWRQERFDVVSVPCGIVETEIFLHSHQPVRTVEDFEGMRVRTAGSWAEIAPRLGATTVTMPGSEVFGALERRVVDAIEWSGPGLNLASGFHTVANYIITPGIHQPSGIHECIFNPAAWDRISERDQKLIELAGQLTTHEVFMHYARNDILAFDEYISGERNTVIQLDDSFIEAAMEAANAWATEQAANDEWFARIYESQSAFQDMISRWGEFRLPIGASAR
ncbi:MAG: C4-dicarboxylate ABC transporter substrate-binding protein [Alkalilacustris sp.]